MADRPSPCSFFRVLGFALIAMAFCTGSAQADRQSNPSLQAGPSRPPSQTDPCKRRPTRRIDLVVNLDAEATRWSLPSPLAEQGFRIVNHLTTIQIHDVAGRPRTIAVQFVRDAGNEWIVVVGSPPPESRPDSPFTLVRPDAENSGRLRFDRSGHLLDPDELRVVIGPDPDAPTGSGEASVARPDSMLQLRFRTRWGETTQYANAFLELGVEHDGLVCPDSLANRGRCLLADELRGDGLGGVGASIFFDAQGRLRADAQQRIQGRRVDLRTGALESRLTDARIPTALAPPRATRRVRLDFDLAEASLVQAAEFDVDDPTGTAQATIHFVVFDAVGRVHPLAVHFSRASFSDWRWTLTREPIGSSSPVTASGFGSLRSAVTFAPPPASNLLLPAPQLGDQSALVIGPILNGEFSNAPPPRLEILAGGNGRLRFDASGNLAAVAQEGVWLAPGRLPFVWPLQDSAPEFESLLALDFGIASTGLAPAFWISEIDQDGYGPGVVTSARVSREHVLEVVASNGAVLPVSELAFADPGARTCRFGCSNGRDDDRDGLVDFPNDPDCASGFDGSEEPRLAP